LKASEKLVQQHLAHRGFESIVYEPDGNVPPDFLINGTIAIEVRRLNQNYSDGSQTQGLEEVAIPLWMHIKNLVKSLGPSPATESWFVSYRFCRPVESWKTLGPKIESALEAFSQRPVREKDTILIENAFEVDVFRASKVHSSMFLLGGCSDNESGGWLLPEMERNIRHCVSEKSRKIAGLRSKYSQWWLALVDHIGYGLDDFDREMFRDQVSIESDWDRIFIIDPRDSTRYFEI
jgi:hypothetical protein